MNVVPYVVAGAIGLLLLAAGMDWALAGDTPQPRLRVLARRTLLGLAAAMVLLTIVAAWLAWAGLTASGFEGPG